MRDRVPQKPRWGRSDTLDRDSTRVAQIAEVLAWAVERDIPLADALETLPFYRYRMNVGRGWTRRFNILRAPGRPFRPWFLFMDFRWSIILSEMVRDLREGLSLTEVLERYGKNQFPGYYVEGVAYAEGRGRLKQALPLLAEQMSYARRVPLVDTPDLLFGGLMIFSLIGFSLFFGHILLLRFEEVLYDMRSAEDWIAPTLGRIRLIFLSSGLLSVGITAVWVLSRFQAFGDRILAPMPFFGRTRRRFLLSEAAQSIQYFLESGLDLPEAAESAAECSRSYWLQKKMKRFSRALNAGEPWDRAWSALTLGDDFDRWLIDSGSAARDPAEGFRRLVEWIHQDLEGRCKRIGALVRPVITILVAIPICYLVVFVFMSVALMTGVLL